MCFHELLRVFESSLGMNNLLKTISREVMACFMSIELSLAKQMINMLPLKNSKRVHVDS